MKRTTSRTQQPLLFLFFLFLTGYSLFGQEEESQRRPEPQPQEPTIKVDSFGVRVQPQLEFVIPYGVISQRADIPLGASVISTQADFDLASSAVAGEVGLRRRFGPLEPGVRGYQRASSEGFAQPRITGGELRIAPDDRYLDRERGVVGKLDWYIQEDLVGTGALELTESIETLLSEPETGEDLQKETFEILPSLSLEFRSLRIETPRRSADISGTFLRFSLQQRFVDRFSNPASLEGRIATILSYEPLTSLTLEHQLSATTPLYIWDQSIYSPMSLGGFDTMRGFDNGEIEETRGFLARNTLTWQPFPSAEASFNSPVVGDEDDTVKVRFHNLKLLVAADALVAQEELSLSSEPASYLGAGPGAALTVSAGESIHFDLRAYVAWAVGYTGPPIFYLQGAIFSISTG